MKIEISPFLPKDTANKSRKETEQAVHAIIAFQVLKSNIGLQSRRWRPSTLIFKTFKEKKQTNKHPHTISNLSNDEKIPL